MNVILVQEVWCQSSANYDAVKTIRSVSVGPETTLAQVIAWSESPHVLAKGNVTIVSQDRVTFNGDAEATK